MGNDDMRNKSMDRFAGALAGLAVGDALGTTVEFRPPGTFEPVTDMVGGGPFSLEPGQWTDDTSMALCLAESLVETGTFDPRDQMARYVRWHREGHLSCTGRCFDIGNATLSALEEFVRTGEPFSGSIDPGSAGNGSLMRLSPVAMAYASDPAQAIDLAGESSRTTHGAAECVDACRYFAGLLVGLIRGESRDEVLAANYSPLGRGHWKMLPLSPKIAEIAAGSFTRRRPPEIRGTGYVVDSLEASLWAFYHGESFEDAVLQAVNLGDDADTTAAITGQLAGAHWGVSAIPAGWMEKLAMRETIEMLAKRLATAMSA